MPPVGFEPTLTEVKSLALLNQLSYGGVASLRA
jgi:hypothetical protein